MVTSTVRVRGLWGRCGVETSVVYDETLAGVDKDRDTPVELKMY